MTGKPRYFAPKYGTSHYLYRTGFGAHLKNAVPNTLAFRCISIDYVGFCEGCESKKCKIQGVRARARAREVQKTKIWSGTKYSSEVRFILLQASNKNIGRFPKNVGHFPKTWEVFQKRWTFFQHISHVFSLRSDVLSLSQERFVISRPTSSTAGAWLCPLISIRQYIKGSATEE